MQCRCSLIRACPAWLGGLARWPAAPARPPVSWLAGWPAGRLAGWPAGRLAGEPAGQAAGASDSRRMMQTTTVMMASQP